MFQYDLYPYPSLRTDQQNLEYIVNCYPSSVYNAFLHHPKLTNILIVGCGWTEALMGAFHFPNVNVIGIDKSRFSLDIAQRYADHFKLKNLELIHEDFESFKQKGFDTITFSGVLHHMDNKRLVLSKARNILNHDGIITGMVYSSKRKHIDPLVQKFKKLGWTDIHNYQHINNIINYLESLPLTDPCYIWYKQHHQTTTEIVDTWMHYNYRTYSISQLKKLFLKSGFNKFQFIDKNEQLCFIVS